MCKNRFRIVDVGRMSKAFGDDSSNYEIDFA